MRDISEEQLTSKDPSGGSASPSHVPGTIAQSEAFAGLQTVEVGVKRQPLAHSALLSVLALRSQVGGLGEVVVSFLRAMQASE